MPSTHILRVYSPQPTLQFFARGSDVLQQPIINKPGDEYRARSEHVCIASVSVDNVSNKSLALFKTWTIILY